MKWQQMKIWLINYSYIHLSKSICLHVDIFVVLIKNEEKLTNIDFFIAYVFFSSKKIRDTQTGEKKRQWTTRIFDIETEYQAVLWSVRIMHIRSSFRDTITKVKKQFQFDDNEIYLTKYDSIENCRRSSSHIDLSNRNFLLTRQHSRSNR